MANIGGVTRGVPTIPITQNALDDVLQLPDPHLPSTWEKDFLKYKGDKNDSDFCRDLKFKLSEVNRELKIPAWHPGSPSADVRSRALAQQQALNNLIKQYCGPPPLGSPVGEQVKQPQNALDPNGVSEKRLVQERTPREFFAPQGEHLPVLLKDQPKEEGPHPLGNGEVGWPFEDDPLYPINPNDRGTQPEVKDPPLPQGIRLMTPWNDSSYGGTPWHDPGTVLPDPMKLPPVVPKPKDEWPPSDPYPPVVIPPQPEGPFILKSPLPPPTGPGVFLKEAPQTQPVPIGDGGQQELPSPESEKWPTLPPPDGWILAVPLHDPPAPVPVPDPAPVPVKKGDPSRPNHGSRPRPVHPLRQPKQLTGKPLLPPGPVGFVPKQIGSPIINKSPVAEPLLYSPPVTEHPFSWGDKVDAAKKWIRNHPAPWADWGNRQLNAATDFLNSLPTPPWMKKSVPIVPPPVAPPPVPVLP